MRRLYFVLPDHDTTETIVNELLLKRVDNHHIHIVAKDGASMSNLPEANLFQKTDFIPAVERGLAVGGVTGILAGVAAIAFPPMGVGAILGTGLAGAGIGAWVSGMIGLGVPNTQIQQFEAAIEAGKMLMMIDVPRDRVEEIEEMINGHHPTAIKGGTEPHIPVFP